MRYSGVRVDSELIARKLATIRLWLCASPDYLSPHGTPQTMEDLRQHFLIGRMDGRMSWRFQKAESTVEEFEFLPTTVISEPAAAKTLLIAGVGIDRCRRFMEQGSVLSLPLNQPPPAPLAATKVTNSDGCRVCESD
jgi:DNA-binding transcriptional LysR family regulator